MELVTGIKGRQSCMVTPELCAAQVGSGDVSVFSTPMMIALVEKCCLKSVLPYLEDGQGTVGTRVDMTHVSATPPGMEVTAESELIGIDRKRLVFRVSASDGHGLIGEGIHERFIIDIKRFEEKAGAKRSQATSIPRR